MSERLYKRCVSDVQDVVHQLTWDSIEEAAHEKAKMAKELGEVNENSIPLITVVADGAWSKRSYNVNYNAQSGVVSSN